MQVWGPGYAQKLLKSVTRVFTIALPPKMAKPSSTAGGTAKRGNKGAIANADKLAARAKEARAEKRKVPSDEDEEEDDDEVHTSDSDSSAPLIQAQEDKDRRAEKLRKLERDRKAEEALDKTLAEQEARNAKKLKTLTASRNSFPTGDEEVIIFLKIECDYLVDIGVSSSVLVILSFVSRRTTKVTKEKAKAKAEP